MMDNRKLDQIADATKVIYLKELRKVQGVLKEEAALREKLVRLRRQDKHSRNALNNDSALQSVGADLLWQEWVAKMQCQLNMQLSHVMARKFAAMDQVNRAFGQKQAVRSVHDTQVCDQKKRATNLIQEKMVASLTTLPNK